MKFVLYLIILSICSTCCYGQAVELNGVVLYQNSGKRPVPGVKITGLGANSDYSTTHGQFKLRYAYKKPGDDAGLEVGERDQKNAVIQTVNKEEVHRTLIPANGDRLVYIIVCPAGQLTEARIHYYNISAEIYKRKYDPLIQKKLEALNDKHILEKDKIKLNLQIDSLQQQYEEAVKQARQLADYIAGINKDFASEIVRNAIKKIDEDKNIEEALKILSDEKLDEAYKQASIRKKAAEEEIDKVLEGYQLKADLQEAEFNYSGAILSLKKIIVIAEENNLPEVRLAGWYTNLANALDSKGDYNQALIHHQKAVETVRSFKNREDTLSANIYQNISYTYYHLGDFKKALDFQKKYMAIAESGTSVDHTRRV